MAASCPICGGRPDHLHGQPQHEGADALRRQVDEVGLAQLVQRVAFAPEREVLHRHRRPGHHEYPRDPLDDQVVVVPHQRHERRRRTLQRPEPWPEQCEQPNEDQIADDSVHDAHDEVSQLLTVQVVDPQGCLSHGWALLPFSVVVVFEPHDVVLAEVVTQLHLDDLQQLGTPVLDAVHCAERDEHALVRRHLEDLVVPQ